MVVLVEKFNCTLKSLLFVGRSIAWISSDGKSLKRDLSKNLYPFYNHYETIDTTTTNKYHSTVIGTDVHICVEIGCAICPSPKCNTLGQLVKLLQ